MASTSIHLPDDLLAAVDDLAQRRGLSRNKVIIEACSELVERKERWPSRLVLNDHLSNEDLALLREGDFFESIREARRSRDEAPF